MAMACTRTSPEGIPILPEGQDPKTIPGSRAGGRRGTRGRTASYGGKCYAAAGPASPSKRKRRVTISFPCASKRIRCPSFRGTSARCVSSSLTLLTVRMGRRLANSMAAASGDRLTPRTMMSEPLSACLMAVKWKLSGSAERKDPEGGRGPSRKGMAVARRGLWKALA